MPVNQIKERIDPRAVELTRILVEATTQLRWPYTADDYLMAPFAIKLRDYPRSPKEL